jgi:oligopeptide transport system substrate-binding protein
MAKRWDISEDGLTYRFYLRSDVFFHDDKSFPSRKGRTVKASDVVFSFERLLDASWPKPGSWIFKGRIAENSAFVAVNDSLFELHLKEPFQPMLQILTMHYASIVPREAVDYYGRDFRRHPVGTGPFRFKIWAENQALVVVKNDRYFERDENGTPLPYLDAVKTSLITDRKTAFLEFKQGNLDYFYGLESSYIHELLTPTGELQPALTQDFQYVKNPYLNTEYLGIRLDSAGLKVLQTKKIRQALNYGFDRALMLRTLRNGVGKPAKSGFAAAGLPSYNETAAPGYTYDPEKSAKLLAEAGFPNGKGLPEIELLCNQDYVDLATFIARQWEDLGIKVIIELTETSLLRERMRNSQTSFFRASWIAFDKLYDAALQEIDVEKRYELYHAMDRILIEEAPVVFLFYDETAQFSRKGVSGLPGNAINLLSLKKVRSPKSENNHLSHPSLH